MWHCYYAENLNLGDFLVLAIRALAALGVYAKFKENDKKLRNHSLLLTVTLPTLSLH